MASGWRPALEGIARAARAPALFVGRDLSGIARNPWHYALRVAVVGLTAFAIGLLLIGTSRAGTKVEPAAIGGWMFRLTFSLQVIATLVMGSARGAATICRERARGTWGLLTMARIGGPLAVVGKLASLVALQMALNLVVAPVELLALCLGGVRPEDLMLALLLLVELSLLATSLGLCCGFASRQAWVCLATLTAAAAALYVVVPLVLGQLAWADAPATVESVLVVLHPLMPIATWTTPRQLAPALLAGYPGQIGAFLAVAMLLARRRAVGASRFLPHRAAWELARRRGGLASVVVCFALPAIGHGWLASVGHGASSSARTSELWRIWIVSEALLVYLAAPLLAAVPLARQREDGTLPVLLSTPASGARIYLRAMRDATVLLVIGALLVTLHATIYEAGYWMEQDVPITIGLHAACASMLVVGGALLGSSLSPTISASLSGAGGMVLLASIGPFLGAALASLLGENRLANDIARLSVLELFDQTDRPTYVIEGLVGLTLVWAGARSFRFVQKRYPAS